MVMVLLAIVNSIGSYMFGMRAGWRLAVNDERERTKWLQIKNKG